jgi:undecaprenyl pyrophosphate phosphatase UppP
VVGGLASGPNPEAAAGYLFLLATPIVLAGIFEVLKLLHYGTPRNLEVTLYGGGRSGCLRLARNADVVVPQAGDRSSCPFGYYCIGAGLSALFLLHVS